MARRVTLWTLSSFLMSSLVLVPASTFSQPGLLGRLAVREDRLDEDAHRATGRVDAADHAEAESLLDAGALLELDIVDCDPGELVAGAGDLAAGRALHHWLPQRLLPLTGNIVHTLGPENGSNKILFNLQSIKDSPVEESVHRLAHSGVPVVVVPAGPPLHAD